ncbi:hypothetical protein ABI59_17180 [Acidobacteria bacterium Mor1]|nr:hypothetical protein ABI59_17180 [Acidobacteria bacterium Mor1]
MRILHLTRDFPPRHCGGTSTATAGLVAALERGGISCAVASFDDYRPARASGREPEPSPVEQAVSDGILRIDTEADLAALPGFAEAFEPDQILLHVDLLQEAAEHLRRQLGVPLSATMHVCHRQMLRVVKAERTSASLEAQERVIAEADGLIAPTRAAADALLADYPGIGPRLHVAGFTVEREPVAEPDGMRLVHVGRFGAVKGTDRLIDLLPHLFDEPRLTIDIVGGLPRNLQRERRWKERLTQAAGDAADRLHLHGWLDPAERDRVMSRAQALLSVSRIETFGLAALEALARGIPVCGYREPALVETAPGQRWLEDGPAPDVAAGVLEFLRDRDRCLELGRSGRQAIPGWEEVLPGWRAVFAAARD